MKQNRPSTWRDSRYRELWRAAEEAGWRVEHTGKGHLKFISPTGDFIFTGSSISDRRAYRNIVAKFRRCGLKI